MSRVLKESAKTHKDLFPKKSRTVRDVRDDRNAGHGYLSFGGDTLEMFWGFNEYAEADRIFKLRVATTCKCCGEKDYQTVFVDADDLQRHLRWV